MANGRCRIHGGKTPSGIANPNYKTGRYSAVIPARMSERFEAALTDESMLEQRREIGLLQIRIDELLAQLGSIGPVDFFEQLEKLWSEFRGYVKKKEKEKADEKINELDVLIMGAVDDADTWQQLETTIDLRRKVVESERKRIMEAQEFVTLQESLALARGLVESINRHVTDDDIKRNIQSDIIALYGRAA